MTIMSTKLRAECIEVLRRYVGVKMTTTQFEDLLADNPQLEVDLIEFNSPSDTADRERLMDALAVKVIGRSWPLGMDTPKYAEDFFRDFANGLHVQGYKLVK